MMTRHPSPIHGRTRRRSSVIGSGRLRAAPLLIINAALTTDAHALLRTIYHVLASGQEYHNLGPDYYDRRDTDRARQRAVRTLEGLGFRVTIEVAA